MLTAVVVEDSALARQELLYLLGQFDFVSVIGEAEDVSTGISVISSLEPDIVFMDIDLPGGNAFDILRNIDVTSSIIFTTAFDRFALDAYDFNTLDYLLKPIKKARLAQALNKFKGVSGKPDTLATNLTAGSQFFVKDGDRNWMVKVDDVRYFSSVGNHTQLFFHEHRPIYHKALSKIERRLDTAVFFRISRSHIVNLNHIRRIEPWITGGLKIFLSCGAELEVSRRQALRLKQHLSL